MVKLAERGEAGAVREKPVLPADPRVGPTIVQKG